MRREIVRIGVKIKEIQNGYSNGSSPTRGGIPLKEKEIEKLLVEVRYVPLSKEEAVVRQKKLSRLLLEGAIKYSNSKTKKDS